MTPAFVFPTAGEQRSELLRRISRFRWPAIGLSLLLISLTRPAPVLPAALYGVTAIAALGNLVIEFKGRASERWVVPLALLSVVIDFLFCSVWVACTANDPTATNYVIYVVVAIEVAAFFYWPGIWIFVAALLVAFSLIYVEKLVVFHEALVLGSSVFRFSVLIVVATLAASITTRGEARRASAEAAALESQRESARLEMVHRLARGLGASLRRDDVLQSAVGALRMLFPERWSGVLLNDVAGMARLVAANGNPSELVIPIPPEENLPPVDVTLHLDNFWRSAQLDEMGIVPPESLRDYTTAVIVPLHVGGRRLGGLVTLSRANDWIDDEDVKLLEAVAPQVSTALDNARLYEETASLALTDQLTGLGNRRAFELRLEEEIQRSRRHGRSLALVILDIDHFKVYNDTHGHPAGDDILRRLGSALAERLLRVTDLAFRQGGEEFAVIMPETNAAQAEEVMRRVHHLLAFEPLPLGDHQPGGHLTISAGVSYCDGEDAVGSELFEQADLALFGAKQTGRNRTVVYDSELSASLTNWTKELPRILEARSIHAVYQPIVRLDDGSIVAYEALARPDAAEAVNGVEGMFAAAQRMGLLHDLDWLCFRSAVTGAEPLPSGCAVFINITLSALMNASRDPEYMEMVLRSASRPTADVVFEISEREAVTDMQRLTQILLSYRRLGLRFAIDDVGEGHSTFELLAAAGPEYVKIARSLVIDSESAGPAGTIRALVEFGRSTGATVVAEGIEDSMTAARMRSLGVVLGQGYGLGRPAPLLGDGSVEEIRETG